MAVIEISKQKQEGKAPITKMEVKRGMGRGMRTGPRDGSGPRGGTAACPKWGGNSALAQIC